MDKCKVLKLGILVVVTFFVGLTITLLAQEKKASNSVSEVNPFQVSTDRCNDEERMLVCTTRVPSERLLYSLAMLAHDAEISLTKLRELNGWSAEVSSGLIIPPGVKVAFGELNGVQ